MLLSARSCLKRIRQQVEDTGYKTVSEERIREACLANNFDINDAAGVIIQEEHLKIYMENVCIQLGYTPNVRMILYSCIKYKFNQKLVEEYIIKLLKSKVQLQKLCSEENINISEEELDQKVMSFSGDYRWAFTSIQQGL